jgi:L,D-peptidoglycan transpeptidase YkuD (ErfK/YbiS/YcfS/YnhG family)
MEVTAKQKIVVLPFSKNGVKAILSFYEKKGGEWQTVLYPINAVIGKNGIGKEGEGDAKTPIGTFQIGTGFGWGERPAHVKWPYEQTTEFDYWIDDVESPDYNKWVHFEGDPHKRWNSYERLNHHLYKYAAVIKYNEDPIIKGKGSAIFLHVWEGPDIGTMGCVAVEEKQLITILQWLKGEQRPIIEVREP